MQVASHPHHDLEARPSEVSSHLPPPPPRPTTLQSHSQIHHSSTQTTSSSSSSSPSALPTAEALTSPSTSAASASASLELVEAGEVGSNSLEVLLQQGKPFEQYPHNLTPPDGFGGEDERYD